MLKSREEKENSADAVTGMLYILNFPVYAFIDPGSTLSFVTPLLASRFDVFPEILHEPIPVSTPIGDGIRAESVYNNCRNHILDRVTHTDLLELAALDLDIILGMDWIHKCYAIIDCRSRVVRF